MTISGPAFNEAIERWKTLNDFGLHAENLSTLPAVRLKNLARYAGMTSVFNIARMSPQKRMAVLVAFVLAWETLALDDALDVLDAMLAVIIRDARKIGQKKRLRSLKDLDKSALALASACSYLLKEETPDESIRAEVFSYIPRQKLAEIITLVREIARPSDDNFQEIYKEYRKEFVGEGQIFFYYKRKGMETIPGYNGEMTDLQYQYPMPDDEIALGGRI